ncbi:MAG TPA: STAS domain-containing protein [Candidatus Omnitrophota bacterium]|nr:STAS domain-containing protein [Candidatus Omnitrophota bacterium]HPD84829.1 STAS domain-containing protein [Candidatus Omnitrophota bacterium]HRZ03687.1 STAS domain-containing protein [Candidatus Omnitrophota bacterium]
MEIKTTTKDGATIIQLSGSLDGNTVNEAQEKILPFLSSDKISLVLDLKECSYISSAGLRLLLMAAKQLSTQNGILALSGLSAEIKDVMEMTGFNNFFKSFESVAAALEAFKKEA